MISLEVEAGCCQVCPKTAQMLPICPPPVSQVLLLGSSTSSPGGLPSLYRTQAPFGAGSGGLAHSSFSAQQASECPVQKAGGRPDFLAPITGSQGLEHKLNNAAGEMGGTKPKEIWSLCPAIDYGGSRWVPEAQTPPTVLLATWP